MATRNKSAKQQLREYLATRQPAVITEQVWRELLQALAPISESYLRDLLRATGLPIDQPYAGIRQHTFEELESSLIEMLSEYQRAMNVADRPRARYIRRLVIGAKDRARFLSVNPRTSPDKQAQKREMLEWMLVWLENPDVFPAWVGARKQLLNASIAKPPSASP